MTATYIGLANITLGTATSTVTISSISQSFRDLILTIDGQASVDAQVTVRFNSDSGTNYAFVRYFTTGSGVTADSAVTQTSVGAGRLYQTTSAVSMYNIFDYSTTDKHKTTLVLRDNPSAITLSTVERWLDTAAITSITISTGAATMNVGTNIRLFGIVS
jgi:hypothetical protein